MLSNRGASPTSVSTVAISGANASVFSETDNCAGRSLAASGGSCAINVKFTPSVAATDNALLTITDTAGTQSVGLTGTGGTAPGFSPSVPTIPFGNQQKTVKSSATSVMVANNGSASLSISGVGVSGANSFDFAISANSCSGAIVAVNATCSVSVTFTPSATGAETASLTFTDNAPGSPQSVGLTGTGTDFSVGLAPGGSATATVTAGSPATYNLQVTPISGFNGAVALDLHAFRSFSYPERKCCRDIFCTSDHHGSFHCSARRRTAVASIRWFAHLADGSDCCSCVNAAGFCFSLPRRRGTAATSLRLCHAAWFPGARHHPDRLRGRLVSPSSAVGRHANRELHLDDHWHLERREPLADLDLDRELIRGGP